MRIWSQCVMMSAICMILNPAFVGIATMERKCNRPTCLHSIVVFDRRNGSSTMYRLGHSSADYPPPLKPRNYVLLMWNWGQRRINRVWTELQFNHVALIRITTWRDARCIKTAPLELVVTVYIHNVTAARPSASTQRHQRANSRHYTFGAGPVRFNAIIGVSAQQWLTFLANSLPSLTSTFRRSSFDQAASSGWTRCRSFRYYL